MNSELYWAWAAFPHFVRGTVLYLRDCYILYVCESVCDFMCFVYFLLFLFRFQSKRKSFSLIFIKLEMLPWQVAEIYISAVK